MDIKIDNLYSKYVTEMDFPEYAIWGTKIEGAKLPPFPMPLQAQERMNPYCKRFCESYMWTEPCTTYGITVMPDPNGPEQIVAEEDIETEYVTRSYDTTKDQHFHLHDETYLFFGSNPADQKDLGGEVEVWMGCGPLAEKIVITKACAVSIPAGTIHQPIVVRRVDNPEHPIFNVIVYENKNINHIPTRGLPEGFEL